MVNIDDILSIVIFVMFFAMTITYFSTISKPDRVELGLLAGDIADKLLTPGYLTWNITKTGIFINATSSQKLYPIDLYMPFPSQIKSNSVRVRYHNDGKDVGFVYTNTSTGEFVMLANISAGKNIFDMFYSDTDAPAVFINSDLSTNGLLFSNSQLTGELSPAGDIISTSFEDGDNEWVRDMLFIGPARYQANSHTTDVTSVRIKYDFTNGSATKTLKIYAFNPIIRVNISAAGYTWNSRFSTAINETFAGAGTQLNGSDSQVFSGVSDFIDFYTLPGSTTAGIAFSDKNINAKIYDSPYYREFNISNNTAGKYEIYLHQGSYVNAKPHSDLFLLPSTAQLTADSISGILSSKINDLNGTGYAALKQRLGSSKDFHIQIENSTDGALLLDYGKNPYNSADVVVHSETVNLLTANYDFQKVILRVKTWN